MANSLALPPRQPTSQKGRYLQELVDPVQSHNMKNLRDAGGIRNRDRTRSTTRSGSVQDPRLNGGAITVIPFVYEGREVPYEEAVQRAAASGEQWPAFDSEEAATSYSRSSSEMMRPLSDVARDMEGDTVWDTQTRSQVPRANDWAGRMRQEASNALTANERDARMDPRTRDWEGQRIEWSALQNNGRTGHVGAPGGTLPNHLRQDIDKQLGAERKQDWWDLASMVTAPLGPIGDAVDLGAATNYALANPDSKWAAGGVGLSALPFVPFGMARKFLGKADNALKPVPRADSSARMSGRSIDELYERIPPEQRVLGGKYSPEPSVYKHNSGVAWRELPDLDRPGLDSFDAGLDDDTIQRLWEESIAESGEGAEKALAMIRSGDKTGRKGTPKNAAFWRKALALSNRRRYWYELSTEGMTDMTPDLTPEQRSRFFDIVAATSQNAPPLDNMRRSLSLMGHDLAGRPAGTAILSVTPVRKAFSQFDLDGNKIHNFSGQFDWLAGYSTKAPLSTNDRQVAKTYLLTPEELAKHQGMYEPISRHYQKIANKLNESLPPGVEPYQPWQLQALTWTAEEGGGSLGAGGDYLDAMNVIARDAQEAGVDMSRGFTNDVLTDPKFQQVVDPTTKRFADSKMTTMEVKTRTNPWNEDVDQLMPGASATARTATNSPPANENRLMTDIMSKQPAMPVFKSKGFASAPKVGGKLAHTERTYGSMYPLENPDSNLKGMRAADKKAVTAVKRLKPIPKVQPPKAKSFGQRTSVAEDLLRELSGDSKVKITRSDVGRGTFEGAINSNMRIPLPKSMPRKQAKAFLATYGRATGQDGMAWSNFHRPTKAGDEVLTSKVFLQTTDDFSDADMLKFNDRFPDHTLNVVEVPNGTVIEVNPMFLDDGSKVGPNAGDIDAAADEIFGRKGYSWHSIDSGYDSDYVDASEYDAIIREADHGKGQLGPVPQGGRFAGRQQRVGRSLSEAKISQKAQARTDSDAQWVKEQWRKQGIEPSQWWRDKLSNGNALGFPKKKSR